MLSSETSDILAIYVAATVLAILAGWILRMLRGSPFTSPQSVLYALNYSIARILWRVRIDDRFPIPPNQGAVIVCNHRCPLDPSFIALTTPRVVHWMVAKEYCEFPAFRRLLKTCGVIPVQRGTIDMAAVRAAIRLVQQGELVGIFPEGRINTSKQLLLPGRPGAAMIALKGRVPVVPCYIDGAPYNGTTLGCLFMPARVRLRIGPTIEVAAFPDDQRDSQDALTRQFMTEIASLAGQPGFAPQLFGRNGKTNK